MTIDELKPNRYVETKN